MNEKETGQQTPMRAVRLIFEYDGEQVRLVSQHEVEMAITGFDLVRVERAGYYVESRDAHDKTLARVQLHTAFATSLEVFPERPDEPITRIDIPEPKGAFTVIVPAPENADHISVMRVAPGVAGAMMPCAGTTSPVAGKGEIIEIGRFPLLKKGNPGGVPQ